MILNGVLKFGDEKKQLYEACWIQDLICVL
jgi:hypothetical protein